MTYLQMVGYLKARVKNDKRAEGKGQAKPETKPAGSWQEANALLAEINEGNESETG